MKTGWRSALRGALALTLIGIASVAAAIEPYIVVDVESGDVLLQSDSTTPWFPASTTKLMTTYVALSAVRDGRLTMDTPLTMSMRAARQAPSKMGFRPGTLVTLDNALKMLMVKSPNDIAVMIAESIDGSVEAFAAEMNATAAKLGMHESHFTNPNGLHDTEHYSSARDMAVLARALWKEFPDHTDIFSIGELRLGHTLIRNHNGLIGRYPGADGMKTGFTCPAGFNVVASAERSGRRLIVVVFGSSSPRLRTDEAAMLFDRGFASSSSGGTLDALPASATTSPPNMRDAICRGHGQASLLAMQEDFVATAVADSSQALSVGRGGPAIMGAAMAELPPSAPTLSEATSKFVPVDVFIGPKPGWTGPVLAAKGEPEEPQTTPVSAFAEKSGGGEEGAPAALRRAVKRVRVSPLHVTPETRARLAAAAQRVAAKKQHMK